MGKIKVFILAALVFVLEVQSVERYDQRSYEVIPEKAYVEKLAEGFNWVEGPAWHKSGKFLVFSDIPNNVIWKWEENEGLSVFMEKSGYDGIEPFNGKEPGSNGLAWDQEERLLICEHGNRRVSRLEANGSKTILADSYQGLRLNSPNDVISAPNGDVLFTDPPYGLEKAFDDPKKELPFQGVYRVTTEGVFLLTDALKAPNGLWLSPKGDTLYVSNSDPDHPVWYAFDYDGGQVSHPRVFADASPWMQGREGLPDGFTINKDGYLFAAGPGGLYIIAPDGTIVAFFDFCHPISNCIWGDTENVLFITGNHAIYRLNLKKGD